MPGTEQVHVLRRVLARDRDVRGARADVEQESVKRVLGRQGRANAEETLHRAIGAAHCRLGLTHRGKDAPRVPVEVLARVGERQTARRAPHQAHAEPLRHPRVVSVETIMRSVSDRLMSATSPLTLTLRETTERTITLSHPGAPWLARSSHLLRSVRSPSRIASSWRP
jgi:hypothetical protein